MQCLSRCIVISKGAIRPPNSAERYALIHRYFTTLHFKPLTRPHTGALYGRAQIQASFSRIRTYSNAPKEDKLQHEKVHPTGKQEEPLQGANTHPLPPPPPSYENWSPFYRRLARALPQTIRRPTSEDLLKATDSFWARARIRFKWFTIRSFRRFGADDISAFLTWFLMSQTLWILVGTTTFFSVIFATLNSLRLQEYVARVLSDYFTQETGIQITFESAIVPKWKDSRLSFKNVSVSRNVPDADHSISTQESIVQLTLDSVDVTLSLLRWLEGKGLIQDAIVRGVRGSIDRRFLAHDPTLEPASFRHTYSQGSFHLTSLQLDDILVTMRQPYHRPFTISIFNASINNFRKQWLFYDLLSEADGVVGMYDGCLFSLHRPQMVDGHSRDDKAKMARFRIDGVNVSHLQSMSSSDESSSSSPISWIKSGKVDAVLDFRFPHDPSTDIDLPAILSELATNISTAAAGKKSETQLIKSDQKGRVLGQKELARPALAAPSSDEDVSPLKVSVDIDIRFRDVKAAVPLWKSDLSYSNSALIRPIVAFMNANRTLIPISCRLNKDLEDFDGSWTLWETGLMDDISLKVYDALAFHVAQNNINGRLKTVSLWSLQVTAATVINMIRNILDPAATQIRDIYLSEGAGY